MPTPRFMETTPRPGKRTALAAGLCFFFALVLFPGISGRVLAHPHVFIEQHLAVVFDDKGLAGFRVSWAFDDMFSVMIAEDFDGNKNGIIDPEENKIIREKAFGYIAPQNYYIHVTIDDKPFAVKFITDFKATLDQGKLMYEFFIPCHVTAIDTPKTIRLAPYDPEYYSAIYFSPNAPLALDQNGDFHVETDIRIDKSTLIYYDMVNPWALFMDFRKKG
ncbi:MAG: DUF1007 family protein [Desulfobacter sp.]